MILEGASDTLMPVYHTRTVDNKKLPARGTEERCRPLTYGEANLALGEPGDLFLYFVYGEFEATATHPH